MRGRHERESARGSESPERDLVPGKKDLLPRQKRPTKDSVKRAREPARERVRAQRDFDVEEAEVGSKYLGFF